MVANPWSADFSADFGPGVGAGGIVSSGATLLLLSPVTAEAPATLYATLSFRNLHPILQFDGTTAWNARFSGVMPQSYANITGVTVIIWWSAATATSGGVTWEVSFERDDPTQDTDADSFGAATTATTSTSATSGALVKTSIPVTRGANMDSVVAGDQFRLNVKRLPADAGDTMVGNAEIQFIEIRET